MKAWNALSVLVAVASVAFAVVRYRQWAEIESGRPPLPSQYRLWRLVDEKEEGGITAHVKDPGPAYSRARQTTRHRVYALDVATFEALLVSANSYPHGFVIRFPTPTGRIETFVAVEKPPDVANHIRFFALFSREDGSEQGSFSWHNTGVRAAIHTRRAWSIESYYWIADEDAGPYYSVFWESDVVPITLEQRR